MACSAARNSWFELPVVALPNEKRDLSRGARTLDSHSNIPALKRHACSWTTRRLILSEYSMTSCWMISKAAPQKLRRFARPRSVSDACSATRGDCSGLGCEFCHDFFDFARTCLAPLAALHHFYRVVLIDHPEQLREILASVASFRRRVQL